MASKDAVVTALIKEIITKTEFFQDTHIAKVSSMDIDLLNEVARAFPSIVDRNVVAWTVSDVLKINHEENINHQSKLILNTLKEIPNKYRFYFPMPNSKERIRNIKVGDAIELRTASKTELSKLKNYEEDSTESSSEGSQSSLIKNLQKAYSEVFLGSTLEVGQNILKIEALGFAHEYADSSTLERDPLFTFKVFTAYLISTGALKNSTSPTKSENLQSVDMSRMYSFFVYDENGKLIAKKPTESSDDKLIKQLEFNLEKLDQIANFSYLDNPDESGMDAIKLKNSLYWLFEAMKTRLSDSIYQSVVYTCTAFDAFFNSNESKEQKAKYISIDISNNLDVEKDIANDIVSIYELRNQITHGERQIAGMLHGSKKQRSEDWRLVYMAEHFLKTYLLKRIFKYFSSIESN